MQACRQSLGRLVYKIPYRRARAWPSGFRPSASREQRYLAYNRSAIFLNRSTGGRQEVTLPLTISDRIFKNEIVTLVVS